MFDQPFLAPERQHVSSLRFLASVLMECAAVALLILLSLMISPRLPVRHLRSLLLVPPAPLRAEEIQPRVRESAVSHPGLRLFAFPLRLVPFVASSTPSKVAAAPDLVPSLQGVPAEDTGSPGDVLFSAGNTVQVEPPATVREAKPKGPVAIGGAVAEANLLNISGPGLPAAG